MKTITRPMISLSQDQKKALKQYSKEIDAWKKFLTDLGYKVIIVGENTGNDSPDEGYLYANEEDEHYIYGSYTFSEAQEEGMILCGAGYVSPVQFVTNDYWSDETTDTPHYIEFAFGIDEKAFMCLEGNEGLLLFDKEKYFPVERQKVMGTREEIAAKLFALATEMSQKLRLGPILTYESDAEHVEERMQKNSKVKIRDILEHPELSIRAMNSLSAYFRHKKDESIDVLLSMTPKELCNVTKSFGVHSYYNLLNVLEKFFDNYITYPISSDHNEPKRTRVFK